MNIKIAIGLVLIILFANDAIGCFAGNITSNGLFVSDEVLKLKLVADIQKLKTERDKSVGYIEGKVIYNDKKEVELPVEVKVRGNYRMKEETCDFPPLKLKFDKEDIARTLFADNRKLKLVTHCRDEKEMQNSVMREYLAYRIYNTITDISLKVRLVEITYIDEANQQSFVHCGFLIEDEDDMCKRLSMEELKAMNVSIGQLNKDEMIKMSMFQFMIGNKDWSIPKLHNVILVKESDHVPPVGVPYDFDMSSFVNPPYRSQILGRVEDEIDYKGGRVKVDELQEVVDLYVEVRNEILDLILDMPGISVESMQDCLKQVEEFYLKLETKSSIRHNFLAVN